MEQIIDESVLFQSHERSMKLKTTSITINAGELFALPISTTKPNTILKWVFQCHDYDIEFSIVPSSIESSKDSDSSDDESVSSDVSEEDFDELLAARRYAPNVPHEGQLTLPYVGVYNLYWDNSYSWMREKHVVYTIELIYPEYTVNEMRHTCLAILDTIDKTNKHINEQRNLSNTLDNELIDLNYVLKTKEEQLLQLKQEIEEIKSTIKSKSTVFAETINSIETEENSIKEINSITPFVLQGSSIFSYLGAQDLISLANVNHLLNKSIHQDYIWHTIFLQETDRNLAILLKNDWVLQKWKLFRSDIPVPTLSEIQPVEKNTITSETNENPKEVTEETTEESKEDVQESTETNDNNEVKINQNSSFIPEINPVSIVSSTEEESSLTQNTTETIDNNEGNMTMITESTENQLDTDIPTSSSIPPIEITQSMNSSSPKEDSTDINVSVEPTDASLSINENVINNEESNEKSIENVVTESTSNSKENSEKEEDINTSIPTSEPSNAQTMNDNDIVLTELKLKYSIKNNQGWYINNENLCFYVYIIDQEKQQFEIWTKPLPLEELDMLYEKTQRSNVLIACPGTIQGESGYYLDRHRKVTEWIVNADNEWKEIEHL